MWKIEVWIRATNVPGRWQFVGEVETFEQAREAVIKIAEENGLAQAHKTDATETEPRGMRALRQRGFCFWTGSGGQ